MDVEAPRGLLRFFDEIQDPRMDQTKLHLLSDMLVITLCAVTCGANNWVEIELFGQAKLQWLRAFLVLPNEIPSHDTFGRVFSLLDSDQFERCFRRMTAALAESTGGKLIAIDGKTLRRSFDKASDKAAIHMVSAWSEMNHVVLGQVATDAKSNGITAIPRLLEMLDIVGSVVTIDAMGCRKAIAKKSSPRTGITCFRSRETSKRSMIACRKHSTS